MNWLAILLCAFSFSACGKGTVPAGQEVDMPAKGRLVKVFSATDLKTALQDAKAGDSILLADGVYKGKFVIGTNNNGTAMQPIRLVGSRNAILDADNINSGYVLYLQASHWQLRGFSITNGLKGLMMDFATHNNIDSLHIFNIGEEALHLRKFSSHNTIMRCLIENTGIKTPDYGEGIYVGSAKNNWANYSNGNPDNCDSNQIIQNHIGPAVSAESIDVKEGTTGTYIARNYFDATGITGANSADSWIDVKGNYCTIEYNEGFNPGGSIFKDGYQVHVAVQGWGNYNKFIQNNCVVNASGYGMNVQLNGSNGSSTGNKVYSDNIVTGAALGISNIALSH